MVPMPCAARPLKKMRMPGLSGRLLPGGWRHVAGRPVRARAEEMLLLLLREVVASFLVGKVEPVLVDQHLLLLEPLLPGFLGDVLEDTLAQCARIRWKIKAFCLAPQLYAI